MWSSAIMDATWWRAIISPSRSGIFAWRLAQLKRIRSASNGTCLKSFFRSWACELLASFLFLYFDRCMNISGVNCVHFMRMTAFLTSLNAVGMGMTGECHMLFVVWFISLKSGSTTSVGGQEQKKQDYWKNVTVKSSSVVLFFPFRDYLVSLKSHSDHVLIYFQSVTSALLIVIMKLLAQIKKKRSFSRT